ncbi:MAG: hypothetical protein CM1200mP34_5600 [Verrucomicrobiales bacterium]|nr:MAG: hypothetical protein CM1200mP34_5600 [Verrucomicrobiales bacterium]
MGGCCWPVPPPWRPRRPPLFSKGRELPRPSLSVPGTTGSFTPEKLFTLCIFGALGSMIQPAQWMRFYAAKSAKASGAARSFSRLA